MIRNRDVHEAEWEPNEQRQMNANANTDADREIELPIELDIQKNKPVILSVGIAHTLQLTTFILFLHQTNKQTKSWLV